MKIGRKILWLTLLAGALALLASPTPLLAQPGKTDLILSVLPYDYGRELTPGQSSTLFMEVRNNGTGAITNIRFDSSKPPGWTVEFRPVIIEYLSPGSSRTVDVNVTPTARDGRADQTLTLIAGANETRAVTTVYLRVARGSSLWIWVGAGVAALVVAGFVIVFLRSGRQ